LEVAQALGRALPVVTVFPAAVLGLLLAVALHAVRVHDSLVTLGVCLIAITPRLTAGLAHAIGGLRRDSVEAAVALGATPTHALWLALRGDAQVWRGVLGTARTAVVDLTVTLIALHLASSSPPSINPPSLGQSLLHASVLVMAALAIVAPVGAWSAWSLPRGRSIAGSVLRLLGQIPVALLVLALVARADWSPSLGAWSLAAFLLGAYAPLVLGISDAAQAASGREADEAIALGASPRQVWTHIVLPASARSLRTLALGCAARLVGEAGLFLILVGRRAGW
jgi:hypothetical protein